MSEQCNCEHVAHFPELWDEFSYAGPLRHKHLSVSAGERRAYFVGAVCDDCADTCMKEDLVQEDTEEEFSKVWYSVTLEKRSSDE